MKIIHLLLFFLFSIHSILATHIIGGSITYEYLGGDEYNIKLEVLRDCFNGVADFDNPAHVGVYDSAYNLVQILELPFIDDENISLDVPNNVCDFPPNICVEKSVYNIIVTLPGISGGYTLAYQRCCRSMTISNLMDPLDIGMTFHTQIIPANENSSPQFDSDIPFAVFVNTPFVYIASATDQDGDSLSYELIAPFVGANQDDPMPIPPGPPPYQQVTFIDPYSIENMLGGDYPLVINSETGEMSAIPQTIGIFQIAYAIKEFRNGEQIGTTYREFTFVVIHDLPGQNYDVSGTVKVIGAIPLDEGKVQILERDISTDSVFVYEEQILNSNGEFLVENIPSGIFYTRAEADTSSFWYDSYIPTYYKSKPFWYDATPINQCDTSDQYRDIFLIHVGSPTGEYDLDGIVSHAGRSFDPVEGLNLLIGKENGELLQARTTDEEGYFKFENLLPGTYKLYADLINSAIDNTNPPFIGLNENETVQVYLYEDSLSLQMPSTSIHTNRTKNKYSINIYPNPGNKNINLSILSEESGIFTAKIFNAYGQHHLTILENIIIPEGKFSTEFNIDEFPSGIYFIEIQNNKYRLVDKFIKQ